MQIGDSRLTDRFWKDVAASESGCWLWTGAIQNRGYGQVSIRGSTWLTHRYAFTHLVGEIQDGLVLDHLCRVRRCVNPAHLQPVTVRENCRRGLRGELTTHCVNGHEFTNDNTRRGHGGKRECRECNRQRSRAFHARKKTSGVES